jgi:hypothetical protein
MARHGLTSHNPFVGVFKPHTLLVCRHLPRNEALPVWMSTMVLHFLFVFSVSAFSYSLSVPLLSLKYYHQDADKTLL